MTFVELRVNEIIYVNSLVALPLFHEKMNTVILLAIFYTYDINANI